MKVFKFGTKEVVFSRPKICLSYSLKAERASQRYLVVYNVHIV